MRCRKRPRVNERERKTDDEFSHQIFRKGDSLVRLVTVLGETHESQIASVVDSGDPTGDWWKTVLTGVKPEYVSAKRSQRSLVLADLFCASGGFSTGFKMAAEALGVSVEVAFAVDTDSEALNVYSANHNPRLVSTRSVVDLVDSQMIFQSDMWKFYYPPEVLTEAVSDLVGYVDVVIGGPPCQGHSNLNNHTRRNDGRNGLYPLVASMAVALESRAVLIENVQAVLHDSHESIPKSVGALINSGWAVDHEVMKANELGWPQTRKRHFLAASKEKEVIALSKVQEALACSPRPLSWAIDDLEYLQPLTFMDAHSNLSPENVDRVNYLFDEGVFELPNAIRPLKHQDGHTYPSSYGRLKWDEPAGTITTGFMTPGRGRFVHPRQRRPITAHEAARIQGFPDSYVFESGAMTPGRGSLAKWIGDAVPIPLGYAAAFSVLSQFC